jgi:hypothetical protein
MTNAKGAPLITYILDVHITDIIQRNLMFLGLARMRKDTHAALEFF